MPKHSSLLATAAVVLLVQILVACGPTETSPDALRAADGRPLYADGTFSASFSHTGPSGWRHYVQIETDGGLIVGACYGSIDYSGRTPEENERYRESYRPSTGIDLPELLHSHQERLLETQRPGFSVPPNALEWSVAFDQLVRAALAAAVEARSATAESGNLASRRQTSGSETTLTVGAWEPFFLVGLPDEHGWRGELLTVHAGETIVAAHYRETRPTSEGLAVKRASERHNTLYEQVDGRSFREVARSIEASLVQSQADWNEALSESDAVTGATLTYEKARSLTERTAGTRATPALPRRLCR